ncbi:hypothetical protein L2E82_24670 [Cichorium intybus]|uniref:Uncharacterized protein n=1 Tax=Cichorium intybus TaxID=13427 RepID=A0ACB9E1S6_CICIN|nr:hypothetical protein L2E82_24670 [Cichorium intybus]
MNTFVHMFYEELNADSTVTYVDWSIVGPHPASFEGRDITKRFLESLRKNGTSCLYNKGTTDVCYLFARKFGPSSLEPLLETSSEYNQKDISNYKSVKKKKVNTFHNNLSL